jgi:hypothetical protein
VSPPLLPPENHAIILIPLTAEGAFQGCGMLTVTISGATTREGGSSKCITVESEAAVL